MKPVLRAGCAAWFTCAMCGCSATDAGVDTSGDQNAAGSSGSNSTTGSAGGSEGDTGSQGTAGSSAGANGSTGGTGGGVGGSSGGGASGASGVGGSGGGGSLSFMCADAPAVVAARRGDMDQRDGQPGEHALRVRQPRPGLGQPLLDHGHCWRRESGALGNAGRWQELGEAGRRRRLRHDHQPEHGDQLRSRAPRHVLGAGIYNGGGVYKTTDNGQTFKQVGNISHNDSVSIDFSDPERKTLLAGFHETNGKVWKSTDGGTTWTTLSTLPGGAGFCTATLVVSATNLLVGCAGGGVYHSTDGNAWNQVGNKGVAHQPLLATDGTIIGPDPTGDSTSAPTMGHPLRRVADANLAAPDSVPAELPDGRVAIVGKDHLQISSDKGVTWKPMGIPYPTAGVAPAERAVSHIRREPRRFTSTSRIVGAWCCRTRS